MILQTLAALAAIGVVGEPEALSRLGDAMADAEHAYESFSMKGTLHTRDVIHDDQLKATQGTLQGSSEASYGFARDHGQWKLTLLPIVPERTRAGGQFYEVALIHGPERSFFLRRRMESTAFSLEYAGNSPAPAERTFLDHRGIYPECQYSIWGFPVSQLLKNPRFRVRSVGTVRPDGDELTRIDFACSSLGDMKIDMDGGLIVDPAHGWRIREYDVQIRLGSTPLYRINVIIEYARDGSGPYRPRLVEYKKTSMRSGFEEESRLEIDDLSFGPPPREEFTLDKYGMGDAMAAIAGKDGVPTHWLLFGVAAAALAGRVGLGASARHRARHASSS